MFPGFAAWETYVADAIKFLFFGSNKMLLNQDKSIVPWRMNILLLKHV